MVTTSPTHHRRRRPKSARRLRQLFTLAALTLAVSISMWWAVAPPATSPLRAVAEVVNPHIVDHPEVSALRGELVASFRAAQAEAAQAGHALTITSGYRTPERQAELLEEAIQKYGSREAALVWVFEPDRSMHVQGLAIDVGDGQAADWLDHNGHRFGLCRTLDWEWWHFEWRSTWAETQTCPDPVLEPGDAPGLEVR